MILTAPSERDLYVIRLVAGFQQLKTQHVYSLAFKGQVSQTPCERTLRRLRENQYLSTIEQPRGGARGGSGQNVYQLGRRGYYLMYSGGEYRPRRAVDRHRLAIADSYVVAYELQREGVLTILGYSREPDCWSRVDSYDLRPDLLIELEKDGRRFTLWLEIDMATEGQKQIKAKLTAYWRAHQISEGKPVLWVACDEERATELRWIIGQGPEEAQALFKVTTLAGLRDFLMG